MLQEYDPQGFHCELLRCAEAAVLRARLTGVSLAEFRARAAAAEKSLHELGVTFTVYSGGDATDRILPFDPIPRVLSAGEWRHIERGIVQRVTALNLLLDDLYHRQLVLRDRVLPPDLVLGNGNFHPLMRDVRVPQLRRPGRLAETRQAR